MWLKNLYNSDNQLIQKTSPEWAYYKKFFINPLAESLYNDLQKSINSGNKFKNLNKSEKTFWHDYVATIPVKYNSLSLIISPFEDFCRTCLITEAEIGALNQIDNDRYISDPDLKPFLQELNYLIPYELKKTGYQVIRYEESVEIKMSMVKKLARAIHSGYLRELRTRHRKTNNLGFYSPGMSGEKYVSDFDNLPDEIKLSNIDNAAHIPIKLLSIGYNLRPVKKGYKPFALHLSSEEIETMAIVEHIRWSWEKRLNGWTFGSLKDEKKRTHPSLIPYEKLSESEKEKDRELVKLIPAFLQDIDYEAYHISPNRIKKLSYAIKPQSSIHKILDETRELNEQIRNLISLTPELEEMVKIRNKKIEDAIIEVEESYNYAQYIQETFLPDDLYIRECFTDSFILFKPKDIVSGDFYFFSKKEHLIIFAAADCTGHGIPGALLSTLGYGILDQAVNEIKLTDPALILHHLYSRIHRFLRNDAEGTGMSDDMDITLCVLNTNSNILSFSGVNNPLYRITNGEIFEYRSHNSANDNSEDGGYNFKTDEIQLGVSDTLYLTSDGYPDQFGGKHHKKYHRKRFMTFLMGLQNFSMSEQSDKLYEEIEQWREENYEDQTDDILVIGIRI
jgi:serine phosphatase RsbU (regulator of sigma subunit)